MRGCALQERFVGTFFVAYSLLEKDLQQLSGTWGEECGAVYSLTVDFVHIKTKQTKHLWKVFMFLCRRWENVLLLTLPSLRCLEVLPLLLTTAYHL